MTAAIPTDGVPSRAEPSAEQWTPHPARHTVVYDGDCRVCTRLADTLRRQDRGRLLDVVPSQTPGLHTHFPWIPASAYAESLQLVSPSGHTVGGAQALEQIVGLLPRGRVVSWLFRLPYARPLADKFYRWFARNRYRLGCSEHCQLRLPDE